MECSASADNCGGGCQNQRFQRKQYARVSVIKTEKKGFGLRADADLQANDFVYEYIGEVINEPTFRRRMLQYDEDGIKHFYFMSLHKGEFVDATKKGNLGRFCNHSCNPNCYVDKWVVGDKFRMGIFALRPIRAGEELVFNYNVDRYGADPQPCYCGEPNCVGFIGGKTQTERSTKLPTAIIEALGIDYADGWDTSVAKKPRKKRPDEDDEEYVASIQARGLDEEDARKVMAALVQCKEKWIAVKLLERIQDCDDERVIHCVMRMHAYQILKTTLNTFIGDHNVVLQVLSILDKFPRMTRNKIQDSHIDTAVEGLTNSEHEDVASKSKKLLDEWSKLEVAYRIRRRKADQSAPAVEDKKASQPREEDRSQSTPKVASPRQIDAPKGPRNTAPQRNNAFFHNGPRQRRPPFNAPLPQGWFAAKDARGHTYFYDKQGTTTWQRPTQPAEPAQKAPSKAIQEQLLIQSIIAKVTKEGTPKQPAPQTPQPVESPVKDNKKEKWRSLPIEKQMKLYENTVRNLHAHTIYCAN
jgi:histone-lysine N-methyltransferase SETD2